MDSRSTINITRVGNGGFIISDVDLYDHGRLAVVSQRLAAVSTVVELLAFLRDEVWPERPERAHSSSFAQWSEEELRAIDDRAAMNIAPLPAMVRVSDEAFDEIEKMLDEPAREMPGVVERFRKAERTWIEDASPEPVFTPWDGGSHVSPIPDGTKVRIKYRNGEIFDTVLAESARWDHAGDRISLNPNRDIVGYAIYDHARRS